MRTRNVDCLFGMKNVSKQVVYKMVSRIRIFSENIGYVVKVTRSNTSDSFYVKVGAGHRDIKIRVSDHKCFHKSDIDLFIDPYSKTTLQDVANRILGYYK